MSDKDVARQALERIEDADKEKRISLYREQFKKLLSAIEEDKKTIAEANRRKQIREKMVDYLKAGQLEKALELQEELGKEASCLPFKVAETTLGNYTWLDSLPVKQIDQPILWLSRIDVRNTSSGAFNIGSRTIII